MTGPLTVCFTAVGQTAPFGTFPRSGTAIGIRESPPRTGFTTGNRPGRWGPQGRTQPPTLAASSCASPAASRPPPTETRSRTSLSATFDCYNTRRGDARTSKKVRSLPDLMAEVPTPNKPMNADAAGYDQRRPLTTGQTW